MKALQPIEVPVRGAQVWPLSVAAYHALGEAGLIPKRTELLYGFVYQVELHRRPAGDQFAERAVHAPGGRLISAIVPEFSVELDALFAK